MKRKILFVDDQPEILRGLRRMLFEMGREWEMDFADGGINAMTKLETTPFDAVVSDMRMPVMDGAELLSKVKEKYPRVIRIILSGYSDRDLILKSVGSTHQFLAKPLDGKKLKDTLTRAINLRDILSDANLKKIVGDVNSLPSISAIYKELMDELQNPDVKMQKIGEIISRDVGMTAKMMQLVNSAFFGLPVHISDPIHAAKLLGPETIKALVISVQIFSKFEDTSDSRLSLEDFTKHSLSVAQLAKKISICENQSKAEADNALIAGMLHDVGILILAKNVPEKYNDALNYASENKVGIWQAEKHIFGTTHQEVGAYLLGLWGLPDDIIEAIALHHEPCKNGHNNYSPLTSVHFANAMLDSWNTEEMEPTNLETESLEYLNALGLAEQKISDWQTICKEIIEKRGEA